MISLRISPGLEEIEQDAFASCSGLAGKKVTLPSTVNVLRGGAFGQCYERTEDGTYRGVVVELQNRDLELTENDPSGSPGGGIPSIVTIEGKEYENPFGCGTEIIAYELNSFGDFSMPKKLYDTVNTDTEVQYGYSFRKLGDSLVSHTVSGRIPEGARVKIMRAGEEIPVMVGDSSFSASAEGGEDISVTVSLEGYYNKYFVKTAASFTAEWDLGEITFSDTEKLPMYNILQVDFGNCGIDSFSGLELTLEAGNTVLEQDVDYVLQYPYIILKDSVTSESLSLTVNADEAGYTAGNRVTVSRSEGVFPIMLTPWGKLQATVSGSFAGENHILVF